MHILKTCELCKKEFIARTTVTKTCSDACAKRLYKLKQRTDKICRAEIKEEIKRKPKAFVTEEQIRAIQAKEYLTLKEAAFLLNIASVGATRPRPGLVWYNASKGAVWNVRPGYPFLLSHLSICLVG